MNVALAVLCATIGAAPRVLILAGPAEGVEASTRDAVLGDIEARLKATKLDVARSEARCDSKTACLADEANRAGAAAALSVTFFRGPRSVTVDLDARSPAGEQLEVLTTRILPGETRLSEQSAPFFAALAQRLSPADRPVEANLQPPSRPAPAFEAEGSRPRGGPGTPLVVSGAGLVAVSLGLLIGAVVSSSQLRSRISGGQVITGLSRKEAQSQADLANGLGTASLISCVLGVGVAGTGGVVLWVDGGAQRENSE